MWIKDTQSGKVFQYGHDRHDSLEISGDGRTLSYYHLQCGDGSRYGSFLFVTDENGNIPDEDKELRKWGADAYFNIGGFSEEQKDWRTLQHQILKMMMMTDNKEVEVALAGVLNLMDGMGKGGEQNGSDENDTDSSDESLSEGMVLAEFTE